MTAEVGEVKLIDFKLFDRVKTISECNGFFEIGAEGEIVGIHTEDELCLVKFSEGNFAKDCNGTWYAKFEKLIKLEDENV